MIFKVISLEEEKYFVGLRLQKNGEKSGTPILAIGAYDEVEDKQYQAAGTIEFYIKDFVDKQKEQKIAEILNVSVAQGYNYMDVAGGMLLAVEDTCKELGVEFISMSINSENRPLQFLAAFQGFKESGRRECIRISAAALKNENRIDADELKKHNQQDIEYLTDADIVYFSDNHFERINDAINKVNHKWHTNLKECANQYDPKFCFMLVKQGTPVGLLLTEVGYGGIRIVKELISFEEKPVVYVILLTLFIVEARKKPAYDVFDVSIFSKVAGEDFLSEFLGGYYTAEMIDMDLSC